jgi:TPR repeat protein
MSFVLSWREDHEQQHQEEWAQWTTGCGQCVERIVAKAFKYALIGSAVVVAEARLVLLCVAPAYPRSAFLLAYIAKYKDDDEHMAVAWGEMAAAQGDLHGICLLADLLVHHHDLFSVPYTAEEAAQAMQLYRVAAKGGLADAQYKLGLMLVRESEYKSEKEEEGYDWLLRAATQKSFLGTNMLVEHYGSLRLRTKHQFRRKFLPWLRTLLHSAHRDNPYAVHMFKYANTLLAGTFWCSMLTAVWPPRLIRRLCCTIWAVEEFYYQQQQQLWLPVELLQHIFSFVPFEPWILKNK